MSVKGAGGAGAPRLVVLFVVLAILASDGLPAAQERQPIVDSGAYRRPLGNDPATLDPARIRDVYSLAVAQDAGVPRLLS